MKDLAILTADKDAEQTLKALLSKRQQSLGIRAIEYDIFVHPERDSGVRLDVWTSLERMQTSIAMPS